MTVNQLFWAIFTAAIFAAAFVPDPKNAWAKWLLFAFILFVNYLIHTP